MSKEGVTESYINMVEHLDWMGRMCLPCMHVGCVYAYYACMVMVIFELLFHHDSFGNYDVIVLVEMKQEIHIIKVRLQH